MQRRLAVVVLLAGTVFGTGAQQADRPAQPPTESHSVHFVTVKFDYDFSKTPPCSAKVTKDCVQQFVAYDISAGVKHRRKLFEIPLPADTKNQATPIAATSPQKLDFESGKHLIAVVAQEPNGVESKHRACTTWIDIP